MADRDSGTMEVCRANSVMQQNLVTTSKPPNVASLEISKSSNVHVGPEFVSVTQHLKNTKVFKGRFLGLELVSPKKSRKLQASVAVFVCWALVVAVALALYLTYVAFPRPMRLDIDLNETWYLRRADWQAMDPYGINFLRLPVPYVIIRHTAANYCDQQMSCIEQMLIIQRDHLRRGFLDIGSNYLIGGNGLVFEGRGANVRAEIIRPWDHTSISVTFMGNYRSDETRQEQFNHINVLLDVLVKHGALAPDYILFGHCQVMPQTYSPGRNVILRMSEFPHWNSENIDDCLMSSIRHERLLYSLVMWRADLEWTGVGPCQHGTNPVVIEDTCSHASVTWPPNVQSVNITKSSRVHIGPNIVSVTQNLQKTQVIRVRLLGLSFGSSDKRKGVVAFAFCSILALSALAMFFIFVAVSKRPPQLDIGLSTSWYLRRADWQAMDPRGIEFLDLPVPYVIITETGTHYCNERFVCIQDMLGLQQLHLLRGLGDISPNFLVSGNGLIFEGRGANIIGAMVRYWNARGISIAFMGNYMANKAIEDQFDHINELLEVLVEKGVLLQNYTLYAHCQVQPDVNNPGRNVINKMERFIHWNNDNSTGCLIK